jgi:tRNA(Arg) A34 adenosine deaminase TadA
MQLPALNFPTPQWLVDTVDKAPVYFPSLEERMAFVIRLAAGNIEEETGGPFGAAVFEKETGKLYTAGVNLVFSTNCSVLHAEIVALMMAHKRAGAFDLDDEQLPELQLVSSAEPCAMCLGAIPWSGIKSLVCGARDEDIRKIGFDEGAKPAAWIEELNKRRINVCRDVLRHDAIVVMERFIELGGEIY